MCKVEPRKEPTALENVEREGKELRATMRDVSLAHRLAMKYNVKFDDKPMRERAEVVALSLFDLAKSALDHGDNPITVLYHMRTR